MIYDDTICQLGEGAIWHPAREQFFWFDILGKRLHTKGQHWQFDDYVSAAGWIDKDHFIIASSKSLFKFNIETAEQTHICDLESDLPANRSNDGRADPQGGFWIGTMGLNAEPAAGAIYRYYKGDLRKIVPDIQITNAICFAPDGSTAYYTDTNTQQVLAVDLDKDGWIASKPRVHIDLTGTDFRPDGAVVDINGNLWNAQWGVGRVAVYDPSGAEIKAIDLPVTQSSCPAFGGAHNKTLFVTSANVGLGDAAQEDGKTFAIETDHIGQKEHQVIL